MRQVRISEASRWRKMCRRRLPDFVTYIGRGGETQGAAGARLYAITNGRRRFFEVTS